MLFNDATGELGHVDEITIIPSRIEISLLDPQQFQVASRLGSQILAIEFRAGRRGTHFLQLFAAALVKTLFHLGLARRLNGCIHWPGVLQRFQDIRQRLLLRRFQLRKLLEIVRLGLLLRKPTKREGQGAYCRSLPDVLFVGTSVAARRWTRLGLRERRINGRRRKGGENCTARYHWGSP